MDMISGAIEGYVCWIDVTPEEYAQAWEVVE